MKTSLMPKKRAPVHFTKPANPVHPSLSSNSDESKSKIVPHSLHSASESSGNSVNDQIQRLRLCQPPSTLAKRPRVPISTEPMVLGSFRSLISDPINHGSALHRQLTSAVWPDPDNTSRTARAVRRPPGPPPPKSWLKKGAEASRINGRDTRPPVPLPPEYLDILPDLYLPETYSLICQALKALARNWSWHLEWDQYFLAKLPTRYKETLLYFMIHYSPQGICREGLEILFLDQTVPEDATDNEDLTHLDFATSIGQSLSLQDLEDFLTRVPGMITDGLTDGGLDTQSRAVPETWDAPSASPLSHISVSRFPSLTHLSLAHPTNASWKSLLSLVSHLATLTHLSLAFWPSPTLHSNSKKDIELPVGYGYYDPTQFFAFSDTYWTEAAAILRHLSKKTYCLKWLDLTGCSAWIWALRCESGADWSGAWRRLETIKTGQGWVPDCLKDETLSWHREDTNGFRLGLHHSLLDMSLDLGNQESEQSKEALANWLRNEKHIAKLEREVNEIKSRVVRRNAGRLAGAGPSVDELTFGRGELESWWEDPLAPKSCSAVEKHDAWGNRVVFERGWEGWWIEDAIAAIDKLD